MAFTAYPRSRYVSGAFKRTSDCCGFDFLSTQLIRQWDGYYVCQKCLDPKPHDLLRRKRINHKSIRIF